MMPGLMLFMVWSSVEDECSEKSAEWIRGSLLLHLMNFLDPGIMEKGPTSFKKMLL